MLLSALALLPLAGGECFAQAPPPCYTSECRVMPGDVFAQEEGRISPEWSCSLQPDAAVIGEDGWPVAGCDVCLPSRASPDRYVFADALFWTLREGSADNWAQVITPKGLLGTYAGSVTLVDAPFDWNAGVRVGMGRRHADEGLEGTVSYTNFSTRATNRAAGEVYSAFLGNFFVDNPDGDTFGPHYRSADIDWDVAFHAIDLEVGRSFRVAPKLVVRPFIGLKAAIIRQSIHSRWRQPIDTLEHIYLFESATEDLKQDFWGIGPSVGVTLEMPLYTRPRYTLKLFGTPSGSLMYGHWTSSDVYAN
ncbi:MAG: Lpg1974 family pore-forming outer membrane protein, partial [Patescibacteria group bacterium]|nr:Lpg1974 family pore-forming outer membrane protein [Patescibacteria group bacterium]